MEGIELVSFQIIASVGAAKSLYVEAIRAAKEKDFDLAEKKMEEALQTYNEGHHAHARLIQQEADETKDPVQINLILMHAEDQMITTDLLRTIAEEMIEMYKVIYQE